MRKKSDKFRLGDILQNTANTPKDCQGHEEQEKTKKLSQRRLGRHQLNAMWYPAIDPGTEKGQQWMKPIKPEI